MRNGSEEEFPSDERKTRENMKKIKDVVSMLVYSVWQLVCSIHCTLLSLNDTAKVLRCGLKRRDMCTISFRDHWQVYTKWCFGEGAHEELEPWSKTCLLF